MKRPAVLRALALAAVSAIGTVPVASAALRSWNAPAGGTFSVAANWLGGVAPVSGDAAAFNLADSG